MESLILVQLREIEQTHGVTILFAIESGSRAWGFASDNSDYDVRFVYQRPVRDYIRIQPHRDVIEVPISGDLDINGWDLPKAMELFAKSNPGLLEWLFSPIVYLEQGDFADTLRKLAREHYSLKRLSHHYLSMAETNYTRHIAGKDEVMLKKYLYVIRPLICIHWMEQKQTPPPTSVWETLEEITMADDVRKRILDLLHAKQQGSELGKEGKDEFLNGYIDSEIHRIRQRIVMMEETEMDEPLLNELMWQQLGV
ncbi:nucleotidyltransferase domain-containing protein [Brevibacillus dissolubilis]|uniref:nucleotidyltransferase domain-containing protein n=1 Tax=Brevibacillus dissolubilis TaxID=1844116 RepID=UPI0011179615|nr:nucleotidyltransferase domain-containing protein [Brevibacillus dissolubilis]